MTASAGTASFGTSTYATGASPAGAGASGKTAPIVVVRHPEKKAGTSIEFSRCAVVQSRQPTGPWRRRYSTASGVSRLRLLQWNETKMGRRLRCSGKPWRIVNSACMYQPRHSTHVPSGIGWYIDASRWTAITSRSASRSSRAELRPGPVSERREQIDQLALAVEAHAVMAYDVRQRGDALDVIADVGRGAGCTRMPVVHDREHRALVRGGGSGGRVRVGVDP